ncbi:hypothetical protein HMPREF9135_0401 [Segatella baroniae F0067]|uniref:Uncharacterized protein n=1 Tax=Segatella baroniae F0067 TaxID=1115809 RepID=U2NPM7_9BACT|nr:hypothetical protein HMPREF9135_0401 [Segatella baroniae F0067]
MQYQQQPICSACEAARRCDLLENNYLCSISNNQFGERYNQPTVVICLKTTTFAVSATTGYLGEEPADRCDLLENNYLCSISNNLKVSMMFRVLL